MKTETKRVQGTLEALAPGEHGVILRVGNERGPVKRRLVDMGLTPGTEILVRRSPPSVTPLRSTSGI